MENDDLIMRSTSPIYAAALESEQGEQTVQNQTTASLVPRSRSHEDLQAMLQEPQSMQARDVQLPKKLQDMKKLMKQEFEFLFERSRGLVHDDFLSIEGPALIDILTVKYKALKGLRPNEFELFRHFILGMASTTLFVREFDIIKEGMVGISDNIYLPSYLCKLNQAFLKGEKLFNLRLPLSIYPVRFVHNCLPKLLFIQMIELSPEIFESAFIAYPGKPLMYKIKNALLCLYTFYKIFPKLVSDSLTDNNVKIQSNVDSFPLGFDQKYNSIFNFSKPKYSELMFFLKDKIQPIHSLEVLLKDFLAEFDTYQKELLAQPYYAFVMKYVEFYISQHKTLEEALENPKAFPDDFLVNFYEREGADIEREQVSFPAVQEAHRLNINRYNREKTDYFSRDDYRLSLDKVSYSNMVSVLEINFKKLFTKNFLQDSYIQEVHKTIQEIFAKLKNMDLASPAYTKADVNLILDDLRTLRRYLDTLKGTTDLIKGGDIKIQSSAKKQPVKKKKPVNKKKKKVQAPAPVVNLETPASTAVPKKVVPVKMTPQKRQELESIKKISQRVSDNLERENQYYAAAKNYILSLMSNSAAQKLVEVLFAPKSNLKNIMSQKEMTLIVEQMSEKIGATSENLKGSNGFRFRVEDEIYTSHASSAEIGHKGHGGAVKDFRDFLIAVYALSFKKR